MMEDSQRDLWLGTHQGLTRMTFPSALDPGAGNQTLQVQRYDERHGLPDSRVMSVFEDRDGAIWVGMWSGGPARLKPGSDRFERIPGIGGPEGTVFSISQDQYGYIWFGTRYGAYRLDIHDGDIA
ncbi:MAG: two-component regulator propeller domain-containing protein, partial [Bacteroidota bacterium]